MANYFCEFDICELSQFCCAENVCCEKPKPFTDLWYMWFGILLLIITVAIAVTVMCRMYCKRRYNNYVILQNVTIEDRRSKSTLE